MTQKTILIILLPLLLLSFLTYKYFDKSNTIGQEINFIQEGVLIKNNPGLKSGVWYLSYEKTGQPGLKIELEFNGDSKCVLDEEIDCSILSDDLVGIRVKIEGFKNEEKVLVCSLEKKEGIVENVQDIARNWIEDNSPTYNFDGENLTFVEERGLDLVGCENCYEVEYEFQSRYAGYGDRTGEVLAQVITSHNIVVLVEDGEIKRAITDGIYNEVTEKFLLEGETITISLYFLKVVDGQEQIVEVQREVPYTLAVARTAIEELLKGPLPNEGEDLSTAINDGVELQSIKIEGGIVMVDFNEKLEEGIAGSAWVGAIRNQIEKTLEQFNSIEEVVISINGESEEILQP